MNPEPTWLCDTCGLELEQGRLQHLLPLAGIADADVGKSPDDQLSRRDIYGHAVAV